MKIKYAITSCNDNKDYYEFWPLLSKVWKQFLKIEPILIYIGENLPEELENNKYGQIIKFKPINNLSTATQSQFIRLWYATQFPDDICCTTDIDMFPLSWWYFKDQIRNIDDDKYVFLSEKETTGYNICYNIASGKNFSQILDLQDDFESTIINYYNLAVGRKENTWFLDESYLTEKLNRYKGDKFIKLTRPQYGRINRTNFNYNPAYLSLGMYYDYHSARPYSIHKKQIDALINYVTKI